MVCRLHRLFCGICLIILFSFVNAVKISAEENSPSEKISGKENYYKTTDENNHIKFVQKLSWQKLNDIAFYEIQIQIKNGEEYEDVLNEKTEEAEIEVSLSGGTYRFRVTVYDLFEKAAARTEWKYFKVIKALQPEIKNVDPNNVSLNDKKFTGKFTLRGLNLFDESVLKLHGETSDGEELELKVEDIEIVEDGSELHVSFPVDQFREGIYSISVTNPGGLTAESPFIKIKTKKDRTWEFLASAGYSLPIEIADGTMSIFTKSPVSILGANLRTSVLFWNTPIGKFGAGLDAYWWTLKGEGEAYSFTGNMLVASANVVYSKYFIQDILALEVRAGGGIGYAADLYFKYKSVDFESWHLNSINPAFNVGAAVQYYPIKKHLFVELNLEFVDVLMSDMNYGNLIPSICVGGRF